MRSKLYSGLIVLSIQAMMLHGCSRSETSLCGAAENAELPVSVYNDCDSGIVHSLRFGCYKEYSWSFVLDGGPDTCPDLPLLIQEVYTQGTGNVQDVYLAAEVQPEQGSISLSSPAENISLGQGRLSCNRGWLRFGPTEETHGACSWIATRLTTVEVISDDVLHIGVVETRDHPKGSCGARPDHCSLSYRLWADKP